MSFGNTFETDLLKLIFNATTISNIADNAAASPLTNLYLGLHTADPGEAGDQSTSEAAYTGYARVAVARTTGGFTISGNQVTNAATINFPACTGGSATITHLSIGVGSSGATKILAKMSLGTSIQGPFTATTADVITIPGHTLAVNDLVAFYPSYGSSLPTGITEGSNYYVKTVSGNDITISATQGGATLDITAAGDGVCVKTLTLAISSGITPSIAAGALSLQLD